MAAPPPDKAEILPAKPEVTTGGTSPEVPTVGEALVRKRSILQEAQLRRLSRRQSAPEGKEHTTPRASTGSITGSDTGEGKLSKTPSVTTPVSRRRIENAVATLEWCRGTAVAAKASVRGNVMLTEDQKQCYYNLIDRKLLFKDVKEDPPIGAVIRTGLERLGEEFDRQIFGKPRRKC